MNPKNYNIHIFILNITTTQLDYYNYSQYNNNLNLNLNNLNLESLTLTLCNRCLRLIIIQIETGILSSVKVLNVHGEIVSYGLPLTARSSDHK